jgi:hypothetical protein
MGSAAPGTGGTASKNYTPAVDGRTVGPSQPIGPMPVMPQPTNPNQPRNASNAPPLTGPIPVMPQPTNPGPRNANTNPYIPPIISGPIPKPGGEPQNPGPKIDPGTGPNVFTQSSAWLDQAAENTRDAIRFKPPQLADADLNPYMNPYTQSVIDTSMKDLERSRLMTQNDNGARATAAGAFGGSRHGLVEAETNRGYADEVGRLSSSLNQDNFRQAQAGAQSDIQRQVDQNTLKLGAAGQQAALSGQAFGYGQQLTDNQLRQGEQQRAIQQQIIDAGRAQWDKSQQTPDIALQRFLAAIGGAEYPTSQSNTKTPGWGDFAKYFLAG